VSETAKPPKPLYTGKQGQYLGFILKFTKARGCAPSESEIQMHFGVSAPTVHQMIVRLTELGLIERIPYAARSIRVLVPEDQMPAAVAAREAAANPQPKATGPKPPYTAKQGQYLAFIHNYTRRHKYPPSELDIQMFFSVSAPSVHLMIVTLTRRGFIERIPYTPRSIRILLPPELLPQLEM
jgi:Mn-dependent DtxR family transcriptional regulator